MNFFTGLFGPKKTKQNSIDSLEFLSDRHGTDLAKNRMNNRARANAFVLAVLRDMIIEDGKAFAYDPVLKNLIARYSSAINDVDSFGKPYSKVESTQDFLIRIKAIVREAANKQNIKNLLSRSRSKAKRQNKTDKVADFHHYKTTNRKKGPINGTSK